MYIAPAPSHEHTKHTRAMTNLLWDMVREGREAGLANEWSATDTTQWEILAPIFCHAACLRAGVGKTRGYWSVILSSTGLLDKVERLMW